MSEPSGFPDFQRRKDRSGLQVLNRVILVLVILLVLIAMLAGFYPALRDRTIQRAELAKTKVKVAEAQALYEKNNKEVTRLKSDPEYLGLIARDKLDKMKEGETIFRFDEIPKAVPITTPDGE